MSTFKHPVGPQSSSTYWRRRLIVGLGALAVLVVVILIIVRPGSGAAEPQKKAAPPATHSGAPATPAPDGTTIPTTSAKADGKPCVPANIEVKAVTDSNSYAAGELPKLSLSVTNTGANSCTINAGTSQQLYTITSGSEVYWKSSDCQTKPVDTQILLKAHQTLSSTPIVWDRTRSDPATCNQKRDPVPAGGASYHLQVSLGGIQSKETAQFLLR